MADDGVDRIKSWWLSHALAAIGDLFAHKLSVEIPVQREGKIIVRGMSKPGGSSSSDDIR